MATQKNRQINTHFWEDNYIVNLDPIEKLLFMYFLTSPLTDVSGVYEIQIRRIAFDTGIDKDMILKIIDRFSEDGKIFYFNGWIYVKNFRKHQKSNPSIEIAIKNSLDNIPREIINKIKGLEQTVDRLVPDCTQLGTKEKEKEKEKENLKEKENEISELTPKQIAQSFFNLEDTQENRDIILPLRERYGNDIDIEIKKFISYWTELTPSGKKQRWEMERTFEVKKRLITWLANCNKFNSTRKKETVIIGMEEYNF